MKWLVIFLTFFMLACDKDSFKQDPIADQPSRIRNGTPSDQRKPDLRPACPRDSLVLEANPRVGMFEEGQPGKVTFNARVLNCGAGEYEIEILNLPKEATFDSQSGVLEYTPPYTLVQGEKLFIEQNLRIRVKTLSKPVVIREDSFVYFVRRPTSRKPIIENVEDFPDGVAEGKDKSFYVFVRDEDSTSGANGTVHPPHLNFVTISHNETNAIPYMNIYNANSPVQDINDKTLWRFTVNIRTKNYENVVSRDMYLRFGLVSVSQFGVLSDVYEYGFYIYNRVKDPVITWPQASVLSYEMQKGRKNSLSFWAVDPLKEGYTLVSFLTDCNSLPGEAKCECVYKGDYFTTSRENGSFCQITWDIPASYNESLQNISMRVTNTNFSDSSDVREFNPTRTIKLLDAPITPPPDEPPSPPPVNPPQPPVDEEDPPTPPDNDRGPVAYDAAKGVSR